MDMERIQLSQSIMEKFAENTGLCCDEDGHKPREPRRYLWTDAFAVCNYLGLYRQSKNPFLLQYALQLVEQVHQILGKHRKQGSLCGWISGLSEEQARLHPTQGGLRIGKPLDEREIGADQDESLEWQQDGQYFHYLTKWMHALNAISFDTGQGKYNRWALELAKVAFGAFVYESAHSSAKKMYWKMNVDLSRPLVASMGHQDPLDGLLTFQQLQARANDFAHTSLELDLNDEIKALSSMCLGRSWITRDPLGLGGLLGDALKLVQMITNYHRDEINRLEDLLQDIEYGLHTFVRHQPFSLLAQHRLAFRELGLAIGLQAIKKIQKQIKQQPECFRHPDLLNGLLQKLSAYIPLHDMIEQFWLEPRHQSLEIWQAHADINNVMLATSLYPDGYLRL